MNDNDDDAYDVKKNLINIFQCEFFNITYLLIPVTPIGA